MCVNAITSWRQNEWREQSLKLDIKSTFKHCNTRSNKPFKNEFVTFQWWKVLCAEQQQQWHPFKCHRICFYIVTEKLFAQQSKWIKNHHRTIYKWHVYTRYQRKTRKKQRNPSVLTRIIRLCKSLLPGAHTTHSILQKWCTQKWYDVSGSAWLYLKSNSNHPTSKPTDSRMCASVCVHAVMR